MEFSETEIYELTESVWRSIVELEIHPTAQSLPTETGPADLTAYVHIAGAWQGAATLACPAAMGRRIAAAMLDVQPDSATVDDLRDAVGEIVNVIGGALKSLVPGPSSLSLPAVVQGFNYELTVQGSRVIGEAAFDCEGNPFKIAIVEHDGDR